MVGLERMPLRAQDGELQAIVETPRGSRVKYAYDTRSGLFLARKVLALGYAFPFPFGFLPSTRAQDGDPVDVLVVTGHDLRPGALVKLDPIGIIQLEERQAGRSLRNDRILAVPILEGDETPLRGLSDIGEAALHELEMFLVGYQVSEGKDVRCVGRGDAAVAEQLIEKAAH